MKIAIYGLPCSGKSTLISKIRGTDKDAIAEGHFSFPSDGGYTRSPADSDSYDVIAYLDTAPEIILDRMRQSEENSTYSDLTPEDLVSWRDFEVSNLRSECFSEGKEFVILDPKFDKMQEFIEGLFSGNILTSPQVSRLAADRILQSTDKHTIILSDGDRTLSDIDLTLSLDLPRLMDLRDLFYGDRYTTFQFWYVYNIYREVPHLAEKMRKRSEDAHLNRPLLDDLSQIDSYRVVITAGLEDLWSYAIEDTAFDMAIGTDVNAYRNMSQFGKAYIARYLKDAGREVIALGDNMVDYRMLLEADRGYVIAHQKKNPVLQKTVLNGTKLKQPASNEIKFEGVKTVSSIHEDAR